MDALHHDDTIDRYIVVCAIYRAVRAHDPRIPASQALAFARLAILNGAVRVRPDFDDDYARALIGEFTDDDTGH